MAVEHDDAKDQFWDDIEREHEAEGKEFYVDDDPDYMMDQHDLHSESFFFEDDCYEMADDIPF